MIQENERRRYASDLSGRQWAIIEPLIPLGDYFGLLRSRIQILTEWMPEMGFQLAQAHGLAVYHWMPGTEDKGCELMIVWPSDNSINWYLGNGFNPENDVLECEL